MTTVSSLAEHLIRTQSVQRMVCAIFIRSASTQAVVAKQLDMSDTSLGQLRIGKRTETKGPVLKRIMAAVLDVYKSVEDYEQALDLYTGKQGLQLWAESYSSPERQRKPKTKPAAQPKFAWQEPIGDFDDDIDDIDDDDDDFTLSIDNSRHALPPKIQPSRDLRLEDDDAKKSRNLDLPFADLYDDD